MLRRIKYNANYVFSRLQPVMEADKEEDKQKGKSSREYAGAMAMIFKSEALGRLDGGVFANLDQFTEPFPELDAFTRNQKIIAKSTGDYLKVIRGDKKQETHFSNPLSLLDELKIIQVSSHQYHLLQMLKQRYSHWPDGRPLEQLFRQSWLTCYYELTCRSSKVVEDIKNLIKLCGEDGIQLLFEQNPQLLEGGLDSLDGMKLEGKQDIIRGFDLTGVSMNGTVFKSVKFIKCKLRTEQISSVTVKDISFIECTFEGELFSLTVLDNANFKPDMNYEQPKPSDDTNQLSRIIYQSCVNQQNELNLDQWLTVMGKSHFLRGGSTPLDDLSRNILSQQSETIIRDYPHKLCEIIHGVANFEFIGTGCAVNFIRNNPQFYDGIIKDVRDLYFDFRTSFLSEEDCWSARSNLKKNIFTLSSTLHKNTPREAILELIINSINCVLFPQPDNRYMKFGINGNSVGDRIDCRKITSGDGSTSTKNHSTSCPDSFERKFNKAGFLLNITNYQNDFDEIWEECSEESKLAIAKHCLSHHIVAVRHSTTVKFMELLIKNQEQSDWLGDFAANMKKHIQSQHERNLLLEERFGAGIRDNTVIDESLPI